MAATNELLELLLEGLGGAAPDERFSRGQQHPGASKSEGRHCVCGLMVTALWGWWGEWAGGPTLPALLAPPGPI